MSLGRHKEKRIQLYELWDINLQWVIINTLTLSRPKAIEEWLTSKLRDEYFSKTYLALKQG